MLWYLSTTLSGLMIYRFFDTAVMSFWILFFKVLINLFTTKDFPSLYAECFNAIDIQPWFQRSIVKLTTLFTQFIFATYLNCFEVHWWLQYLFCFFAKQSKFTCKYNPSLLTPLSYLLINYMSARPTPQILSRKDEYTLHFINFIVMDLYNSLANCWSLEIIPLSVWIVVSLDFLSKICRPLRQVLVDVQHTIDY